MLLRLATSTFALYVVYRAVKVVYGKLTSPLRYMPGPKAGDWLSGNYSQVRGEVRRVGAFGVEDSWIGQYGPTLKLHGFFGSSNVYTMDTKAIHHVLFNSNIYQKTAPARYFLGRIAGPSGLTAAEGELHKRERKIMAPAFGYPQVRELTSIFIQKSQQLRDIWTDEIAKEGGVARLDVLEWLHRTTLDIIGLAGFNRNINALGAHSKETRDEVLTIFERLLAVEFGPLDFIQGSYPITRGVSTASDRNRRDAVADMTRLGYQILADSKREVAESGTFEAGRARDLLSLLVRANISKETAVRDRMSDEEVLSQIITFLVAGHVTTSTAVTWTLFALTQNKAAQARLREEVASFPTENPTMDQLNDMAYLDCVVREGLRVHGPVPLNVREAACDDVMPLLNPWTDTQGKVHETISIPKGTEIFIPMNAMNLDPIIWGPNAREFIPERWESPIENAIPGVWGNMMSFIGGPRGCVGYRFSLVEIKSLMFTLLRNFEFDLAVPIKDLGMKLVRVSQGPMVLSEPEKGLQLPLLIKPVALTYTHTNTN
ncbi:cytochrome P450 [Mycena crocata]|nr:cytochrome P450 [Mycena crocata]